jgi:hypothetical protein
MLRKHNNLHSLISTGLSAVFALGLLAQIQAEDKKTDPTGTWTWTVPGRNGGPERKNTLKLKLVDDKLTGVLISPGRQGTTNETKIADAKIKGDDISVTVTREFGGNSMTQKYNGKLAAGAIKGKIEFERNGETQTRDWEAKREADTK